MSRQNDEFFMFLPSILEECMREPLNKVSNTVKPVIYSTAMNHLMDENNHYWELALPGFAKEEVSVKINRDENTIIVFAQKKETNEEKAKREGKTIVFYEMKSHVKRTFELDETCDTNAIKVKFENGLLTISMPKKKPVPPKKNEEYIDIE